VEAGRGLFSHLGQIHSWTVHLMICFVYFFRSTFEWILSKFWSLFNWNQREDCLGIRKVT
jgi:hypothetical protein